MAGPYRGSVQDLGRRAYLMVSRALLLKADDDHLWQETDFEGMFNEASTEVERIQNYGFTSVPHDADPQQKKTTITKETTGSQVEDRKGAEAVVLYVNGSRDHAVMVAVDDRRHRLKGMKKGESAQYDDQGQRVHIKRDLVHVQSHKKACVEVADISARGSKSYGQDASKSHTGKTRIINDGEAIELQILSGGSVTAFIRLDKDGITFKGKIIDNYASQRFGSTIPLTETTESKKATLTP